MASRGIVYRVVRDRVVLAVVLIAAAATSYYAWRNWTNRLARLTLTAGREQGLRHAMAETLAEACGRNRVALQLIPTAGSEAALDDVEAGRIDMALVQGGLGAGSRRQVCQVAALHVEALHVLVKKNLASDAIRGLDALRGRRVNVGEVGSGTRALAIEVLRFAGLEDGPGYKSENLSYDALLAESSTEALPDAVFMVSLLPSPVARHLVTKHDFRLVPVPFVEAFALNGRSTVEARGPSAAVVVTDQVLETTIPAFTYGVREAVPPEPLRTLGTRMLLVAHRGVDGEAASRVLTATLNTPFAQLAHPPLSPALLDLPTEYPPHDGMRLYQERSKPLIAGDVVDSIEKEVSIAGAVIGGAFFLWQWLKGRFRRMRESGFEHYILRVAAIEEQALRIELSETLDLPTLISLQDDLGRIKSEAVTRFARGDLEGEDLLTGFLSQASNARDYLTRLILHRRDDLERQARNEQREAADLWRETVADGTMTDPEKNRSQPPPPHSSPPKMS